MCVMFFPSHNIALLTVVLKNNYKRGLDNFLLHAYLCIHNKGEGPQLISYLKAFFEAIKSVNVVISPAVTYQQLNN